MKSNENFLKEHRLFRECLEALDGSMTSIETTLRLSNVFKVCFPITAWGKIDWDKIERKRSVGCDPKDALIGLEQVLNQPVDTAVYIFWSSAAFPIIKADLRKVVQYFDDVTCVAPEKFIFNLEQGYILEILISDEMTVGVVPECAGKYNENSVVDVKRQWKLW